MEPTTMGITRLVQLHVNLQFVEMVSLARGKNVTMEVVATRTMGIVPQPAKMPCVAMGFLVLEKNATLAPTMMTRVLVPHCAPLRSVVMDLSKTVWKNVTMATKTLRLEPVPAPAGMPCVEMAWFRMVWKSVTMEMAMPIRVHAKATVKRQDVAMVLLAPEKSAMMATRYRVMDVPVTAVGEKP
jgi:hypothetical protein